jgi:hypothetical protein
MSYYTIRTDWRHLIAAFALLINVSISTGQETKTSFFLPEINYNPAILEPKDYFGFQPGDWHLSFDQVNAYMRYLAEKSDRLMLQEYARSHEQKVLFQLIWSSPDNLENLQSIRQAHQDLTYPDKSQSIDMGSLPSVLQLAYTTHGNEQSGMHAAVFVAYYLAAAQDPSLDRMMPSMVILLDPCMNPDGTQRFVTQVNSHRNTMSDTDPYMTTWNNSWPGGRGNHYLFDLNRDWIFMTQPESKGRILRFHEWIPNVLCDYHEMGSQETYFFQPGVPGRTHAMTPAANQEMTSKIASYHARALDENGKLYFTKESFDDYFYGKGSTYPDVNGSIGILFEQASSRGTGAKTARGPLRFPETIKNQITASFSSMQAAFEMRMDLHLYKKQFYIDAAQEAGSDPIRAWIFHLEGDFTRAAKMIDLLQTHQIAVYQTKKEFTVGNTVFPEGSYYVPYQQRQYRLLKSMFEPVKTFKDSVFYDISAWNVPMSFRATHAAVPRERGMTTDELTLMEMEPLTKKANPVAYSQVGYIIPWGDYQSAKALFQMMEEGIHALVISDSNEYKTKSGTYITQPGDLAVPASQHGLFEEQVHQKMQQLAMQLGMDIQSLETGLAIRGKDLGSPAHQPTRKVKTMILAGPGINPPDCGEAWHHLDQELGIPTVLVNPEQWSGLDWSDFTHVILPGRPGISKEQAKPLQDWIKKGGNVISYGSGNQWLKEQGWITLADTNLMPSKPTAEYRSYNELSQQSGSRQINGAIFQLKTDNHHPLFYGIAKENLAVFHRGTQFYKLPENIQAAPAVYASDFLLSGFVPSGMTATPAGLPATIAYSHERGRILCLLFQPLHRGQWPGTAKIFNNAIFFSHLISSATLQRG